MRPGGTLALASIAALGGCFGASESTRQAAAARAAYLAARPQGAKLTYTAEGRLGSERRVVEVELVVSLAGGFFVQARGVDGAAIFELSRRLGRPLAAKTFMPHLGDPRLPLLLAREIERIYLVDCPAESKAMRQGDIVVVTCALAHGAPPIAGDAGPDDSLTMVLSDAGLLLEKRFFKNGVPRARVSYHDHDSFDGVALPRRIELVGLPLAYELTLLLRSIDVRQGAADLFGG
jgi:hypothetical protein